MKLLLKFTFTFALIPFFLFLKGDLSFRTYAEVNHLEKNFNAWRNVWLNPNKAKNYYTFSLPVKTVSNNKHFNASGLCVSLYDEDYKLLTQTQVSGKWLHFILPMSINPAKTYHVVVPSTADELTLLPGKEKEALLIYEAHLSDN